MILAFPLILLGTWLGFANPVVHIPLLALVLPAGLVLIAVKSINPGQAFRQGWLAASLAYSACLYWVVIPVSTYGGIPFALALPCPLLLGFYLGLYNGFFCGLISWASSRLSWVPLSFLAGSSWALIEFLRGTLFTGFPWLVLSSAFSPWPIAVQGAAIVGAYGLSGILALIPSLAVLGKNRVRSTSAALGTILLLLGLGFYHLNSSQTSAETISIGVVQGNIDQSIKWEKAFQESTVNKYLAMTEESLVENRPDLVIWPETALPFYFQDYTQLSMKVRNFADEHDLLLFAGAPGYRKTDAGYEYFNRGFLIGPDGLEVATYDKEHLVPFGEYVPLRTYLPFMSKLVAGVGDFTPGSDQLPATFDILALGPLICYEGIFPELAQKRVEGGANLLVNISNDAWFGSSSAPKQHLDLISLRAVEQNREIIRATNTGISARIDSRGRVLASTPLFADRAVVFEDVPLPAETRTFYHRFFSLVHWSFVLITLSLLIFAFKGRHFFTKR